MASLHHACPLPTKARGSVSGHKHAMRCAVLVSSLGSVQLRRLKRRADEVVLSRGANLLIWVEGGSRFASLLIVRAQVSGRPLAVKAESRWVRFGVNKVR
jgi:hypothetical protein